MVNHAMIIVSFVRSKAADFLLLVCVAWPPIFVPLFALFIAKVLHKPEYVQDLIANGNGALRLIIHYRVGVAKLTSKRVQFVNCEEKS